MQHMLLKVAAGFLQGNTVFLLALPWQGQHADMPSILYKVVCPLACILSVAN
jgi:hypothetical protein